MIFSLTTHVSYYKIKPRIGNVLVSIIQINLTSCRNRFLNCLGFSKSENHNGLTLHWLLHDCQCFVFIGRVSAMICLLTLIALNLPPPTVLLPIIWEASLMYMELTRNLCRWLLYLLIFFFEDKRCDHAVSFPAHLDFFWVINPEAKDPQGQYFRWRPTQV